jgi:cobalt-zinc-cadmium efflux system membrane fusion protein
VLWADLSVSPSDLSAIHEGQKITLTAGGESSPAIIMFVSPLLDKETRAARVVASIDNATRKWRPGLFVTAEIPTDEAPAAIVVAKTALQTVKSDTVVFVRTEDGFEMRKIGIGRQDTRLVEITEGLAAGERVATANTFVLKAELGKAEAGHDD